MSVDPLAEKYPYNGVYNFSENRVIDGRELEGLEWFNSTTIVNAGSIDASIGLAIGYSRGVQHNIAFDMIGKTQFYSTTKINPNNQKLYDGSKDPRLIAGANFSLTFGTTVVWNKPTFRQAISDFNFSLGKLTLSSGVSGSIDFGAHHIGAHIGIGAGGVFKTGNQSNIVLAISLARGEYEKLPRGYWFVYQDNSSENLVTLNGMKYFEQKLNVLDLGSLIKNSIKLNNPDDLIKAIKFTNIHVYSKAIKDKEGELIPDGHWKTLNYMEEEKSYE